MKIIWWVQEYWQEVLWHYMNKYKIKCETSLRFLGNEGWINYIDPYGWFQWYFRY